MSAVQTSRDVVLEPADNDRLANLCGQFDEHLRQIERRLKVEIASRGNRFRISGQPGAAEIGGAVLARLFALTDQERLDPERVHMLLQESLMDDVDIGAPGVEDAGQDVTIQTRRKLIRARGANQAAYVRSIREHDLAFGIGPAGTGKTYLAVACAVEALESEQIRRIVLVRPAVEAGERLGFLPGDLSQKVDPYLRPMYDALYDMIGAERVTRLIERNVIEIAPLAFMRGRSLNESFVILDEAQNTSIEQMKMFLTRIGFGSRAVVTGDITQVDLPNGQTSGLKNATDVLTDVDGVAFIYFSRKDVVRHHLVQRIVKAYEDNERIR
ncbi:MAG: PhoH family protein [Gammaproteobacteria bacterium]|nr:PhoH family protein [Gammaproteobacteria bacterium]NNF49722.1 PhoH family protein [Woeseiaceae bacterium]MBT8094007.1 PhoH family protein [Gammaproteobacteria bacterium]MBT8105258.1 PhoH family protein [Gammaproteobacteria bacterium]NNK25272.1 PhoH family protein [Woeseiaceae bacterium]